MSLLFIISFIMIGLLLREVLDRLRVRLNMYLVLSDFKPFCCGLCGKDFKHKQAVPRHLKRCSDRRWFSDVSAICWCVHFCSLRLCTCAVTVCRCISVHCALNCVQRWWICVWTCTLYSSLMFWWNVMLNVDEFIGSLYLSVTSKFYTKP